MKALGVIVARGGSRGIPNKNLAILRGRPLLYYTATVALKSRLDRVIISTDSPEIAECARRLGVEVPFMRPAELATDEAATIDVLKHAVEQCPGFAACFCLQPTNPLRTVEDIDGPLRLMEETGCDSVIGYSSVGERHPIRMAYQHGGRVVPVLFGAGKWMRRQELPEVLLRNGNTYLSRTACILNRDLEGDESRPWLMPESRLLNIDTPVDLLVAEVMMGAVRESA